MLKLSQRLIVDDSRQQLVVKLQLTLFLSNSFTLLFFTILQCLKGRPKIHSARYQFCTDFPLELRVVESRLGSRCD